MWEDFVWWLRDLSLKRKFALLLVFLAVLFAIFWFRPLPKEILASQRYADGCHNTRFVEGACRFYDDVVVVYGPGGKREVKSRDHFVSLYTNRFQQDAERAQVTTRFTRHLKHRWTGLNRLVEMVEITMVKSLATRKRVASQSKVALSWRKTPLGWRVYEVKVVDTKRPRNSGHLYRTVFHFEKSGS